METKHTPLGYLPQKPVTGWRLIASWAALLGFGWAVALTLFAAFYWLLQ